jgi:hypothetical protein
MKSPLLSTIRWILIAGLSAGLFYLAGVTGPTIVRTAWQAATDFSSISSLLFIVIATVILAAFPGVMLYSLVTKKLYGFASAVGALLALTLNPDLRSPTKPNAYLTPWAAILSL